MVRDCGARGAADELIYQSTICANAVVVVDDLCVLGLMGAGSEDTGV